MIPTNSPNLKYSTKWPCGSSQILLQWQTRSSTSFLQDWFQHRNDTLKQNVGNNGCKHPEHRGWCECSKFIWECTKDNQSFPLVPSHGPRKETKSWRFIKVKTHGTIINHLSSARLPLQLGIDAIQDLVSGKKIGSSVDHYPHPQATTYANLQNYTHTHTHLSMLLWTRKRMRFPYSQMYVKRFPRPEFVPLTDCKLSDRTHWGWCKEGSIPHKFRFLFPLCHPFLSGLQANALGVTLLSLFYILLYKKPCTGQDLTAKVEIP